MSTTRLDEAIKRTQFDTPAFLKSGALALAAVGLAGWVAALFTDADAAWRAFVSNYFFWLGLALGGVMWSVAMRITNARWGRSLMRFAEGTAFYLPVAWVLFFVLVGGAWASHVYEWVHHPIPHKETWLNPVNVFARTTLYITLLVAVFMRYLYLSLKGDVRPLKQANYASAFFQRLFGSATGGEDEWQAVQNRLVRLSPLTGILYGLLVSLIAFDLLMSMEPFWYSTMFGGFIFMANMLAGMAFLGIICATVVRRGQLEAYIGKNQFWDVGKLMFAFTMVWTYLMWSQYLPIWYGNMPEEIGYVIKRTTGAYENLAWTILAMVWIVPWWILLPKTMKWQPKYLALAGVIICLGLWLMYWMIVIPSQFPHAPVAPAEAVYPGWIDGVANLFFGGLFLASYGFFLRNVPVLPVGDPVFQDVLEHGSHHH
ncbi:MAG: hypothetical protein D6761_01490 [Candidatus Dadabacteria bacterium]|nr:MAG: hypothetical protein D6761_01490 [Candidatus Dadabacteria bacterium]